MLRWLPSILLLAIGIAAGTGAWLTRANVGSLSILVGIASTAIASGLVDLSALIERHRQMTPIRQLAARRIGRIHQLLINLIQELYPDLAPSTAAAWPQALREAKEAPIDLTELAKVYPPRPRSEWVNELRTELLGTLDDLRALSAAGVLTNETNALDIDFRGPFLAGVEAAIVGHGLRNRKPLADSAAELLETVQKKVRVAQKAAGKSWKYGTL